MTAPRPLGPLGPTALGLRTTAGIQDAELVLSQALMMNMHEVLSYYSFHVNNTTLSFQLDQYQTRQDSLQKQVAYPPDSSLRRELNVRILWPGTKDDGIPYEVDSPFCNVRTNIAVRQSLEDWEVGKRFAPFVGKFWPKSSKFSCLTVMRQVHSLSLHSMYDHKSS